MERFGHNLGYIDELHRRYLSDPSSVSEAWQEFFQDYRPGSIDGDAIASRREPQQSPAPLPQPTMTPEGARALRGISAKIVENMETSLEVPTATSVRSIPVNLLEENRRIINQHQLTVSGVKISFTHLLGWAIVRAIAEQPDLNVRYAEIDGAPHIVTEPALNLGLAIDVEKKGQRLLLVPNIKDVGRLDFGDFVAAYDDLVRRARQDALTVEDYQNTTVTLTNPGMIGTTLSVPRLMQGQGLILGIGSIGYPPEYSGMAPRVISALGLSRVMTVTSTYDHRVIQGAASGRLLARIEALLQGADRWYERVFAELGIPREPVVWAGDQNPQLFGGGDTEAIAKQAGVLQLIRAFRVRGHLWAHLDPLSYEPEPHPELELSTYGLSVWDMDREFVAGGLAGEQGTRKLRDIVDTLQRTYCRHVGAEFMHIIDTNSRQWLHQTLEDPANLESPTREQQLRILRRLNVAEAFEIFLHTNYVGQKRFSLEGAETLLPMLDALIEAAADSGVREIILGMAHRGRLNVLAHIVGKSYGKIFGEFEGIDPLAAHGSGDVKYHLGAQGSYQTTDGRRIKITLASNPSHLEAVNPVVEGMVRARQDVELDGDREQILPVLIHGDAAFAGQGVVAETLHLSRLKGYRSGGTVHIVVNNQIGFTTGPTDARSSKYPTDVAKMVHAPILHVNGDHPEEAIRVIRQAMEFRQKFKCDVVVDLFCYRRWGHNEGDDPSYTHPLLYSKIKSRRSVRKLYTEQLLRRGDLDMETAEQALQDFRDQMRAVHEEVRQAEAAPVTASPTRENLDVEPPQAPPTGVVNERLRVILDGLQRWPEEFAPHAKLVGLLAQRGERFETDRIDWALAEHLAFGSLVTEGIPVRLSGEDSGRGTFSHRHAILYDQRNSAPYSPLDHLSEEQARFTAFDSMLSEFAVLGFEYGYSVERPEGLTLWEAQFGDFVNGAQVIIDQFISSAQEKWNQNCSLTLLLPHGYEGQGPEHSSARLERFLQLAAQGNIRVANPSTPAQYFHLLRAQALHELRRPLIVMTPKSLLRHPRCVSPAAELTEESFQAVLDDPRGLDPAGVSRLVLCSGKLFYDLTALAEERDRGDVAICRLELLYPFPKRRLAQLLKRYRRAECIWAQEEPANMGPWSFVAERLGELLAPDRKPSRVSRPRCSSPATGSFKRHLAEQQRLSSEAIEGVKNPVVDPTPP